MCSFGGQSEHISKKKNHIYINIVGIHSSTEEIFMNIYVLIVYSFLFTYTPSTNRVTLLNLFK